MNVPVAYDSELAEVFDSRAVKLESAVSLHICKFTSPIHSPRNVRGFADCWACETVSAVHIFRARYNRLGDVLRFHDNLRNEVTVALLSIVSGSGFGEVYFRSYDDANSVRGEERTTSRSLRNCQRHCLRVSRWFMSQCGWNTCLADQFSKTTYETVVQLCTTARRWIKVGLKVRWIRSLELHLL